MKSFRTNNNKVVDDSSGRDNQTVVNLFKNYKSKNLTYVPNIEVMEEPTFLIFNAKKVFKHLQLLFIKFSIF